MRLMILLMMLVCSGGYANPALEQLNTLLAQKEQNTQVKHQVSAKLKDLQENYYFIFIYRSTCPHCHKFAPVLKDFTDTFQVATQAYSLDGESLSGFKAAPLSPELFQTFYASSGYKPVVPALFLVQKHTQQAYAVLFGEAAPYELARRVDELMGHIEEKFHE